MAQTEMQKFARNARRRAANELKRQVSDTVKLESGCVDCGYNANPIALQFDHLPGYVKTGNIADMVYSTVPLIRMMAEIAKCEVVCANCHAVRTAGRKIR